MVGDFSCVEAMLSQMFGNWVGWWSATVIVLACFSDWQYCEIMQEKSLGEAVIQGSDVKISLGRINKGKYFGYLILDVTNKLSVPFSLFMVLTLGI